MHMIWVGTDMAGAKIDKDVFTGALSHELAETLSDPDSNGITVTAPVGMPADLKYANQIGDNEPAPVKQPHYGYLLNGDLVQPYWSRNDHAYIVPDGSQQVTLLNPIWNGSKFTGQYQQYPQYTLTPQKSGSQITGYSLAVNGDQNGANTNDQITIDEDAKGGLVVTLDGTQAPFRSLPITQINVDTGGGTDAVTVRALPASMILNIINAGTDTVTVGASGSLASVAGTVNVTSHGSGSAALVVDDSGDRGYDSFGISSNAVQFRGRNLVTYSNNGGLAVTSLKVFGGDGGNTMDVSGTAQYAPLTLSTGKGVNTVNIHSTGGAVTITGNGGTDYVTVGADGRLASIGGPVNVSNASGHTSLTVADSADYSGRQFRVTSGSVSAAGLATVNYSSGVSSVSITDGHGNDSFQVDSVASSAPVTIYGNPQDTLFGAAAGKVHFYKWAHS
jgi:hypothetical protein